LPREFKKLVLKLKWINYPVEVESRWAFCRLHERHKRREKSSHWPFGYGFLKRICLFLPYTGFKFDSDLQLAKVLNDMKGGICDGFLQALKALA